MGDTLVVGLGNPILSDDGVGWRVAQALRERLAQGDAALAGVSVDVCEACVGGLTLAEMLIGYRQAVIVDAVATGQAAPGAVFEFSLGRLPGTLNTASAHDTNLPTALRALRRFGAELPCDDDIWIVGVEAEDVLTFSERCTRAVEAAVPEATAAVVGRLAEAALSRATSENPRFCP